MPKSGKDRRSARDQVHAPDQGGGLGSDEDYDWIRYLGEGRTSASAAPPPVQPAARPVTQPAVRPVTQPAARPATLAARSRQDAAPVRERRSGRSAARTESAARASRAGLPPAGYAAEREPPGPADRASPPPAGYSADRVPPSPADRAPLPPADRPSRPSRPPRPTAGPAVRLTAGRPVDLASGRETDLLFNPAADDYGQPLYPEPGSRPGRQQARPDLDRPEPDPGWPEPGPGWPQPDPGWPYPDGLERDRPERDRLDRDTPRRGRPERDRTERGRPERGRPERGRTDSRLDTAEYARPLYPPQDASPAATVRQRRSGPADPLADTDARRRAPDDRRSAGRQGRADQAGKLPRRDRAARTGPQRRVEGLDRADRALTGPQRRVNGLERTDRATDTSPGSRVAGLAGSAALAGVARGDATAIADVTQTVGAGQHGGQAGTGASPEIGLLDRQLRYRGKPPRKPKKPGKPARSGKTGGPRPGPTKTGGARPGPGKGRSRAGQRLSRRVLAIGLAAGVAVLAVAGFLLFWPQTPHAISVPATLGSYIRQQENPTAEALKHRIVTAAPGDVKNVVAAVYEQKTGPGAGPGPQIVVFIGGNLAGSASASDLISAYMTQLHGAFTTSAGKLGGQAACAPGSHGGPAECAWADNDTFGVVVSATLKSAALAAEMRLMRPQVEHVVK